MLTLHKLRRMSIEKFTRIFMILTICKIIKNINLKKFQIMQNKAKSVKKSSTIFPKQENPEAQRIYRIVDGVCKSLDKARLDPVLDVFKGNEMLKEFYMKRILEVIKVNPLYFKNFFSSRKLSTQKGKNLY